MPPTAPGVPADGDSPKDQSCDFYNNYDCKEVLGKGMSSTVRRCVRFSTGEEYAVKIIDLSSEKATAEQVRELRDSTLREIKILKMFSGHKNIISLQDFYEMPSFLFIVFELAKGGELFDYLTRVVTCSEKKTRYIMKQLFEAVAAMHEKNIVHRDIKLENILMLDDERLKLTDFGFAFDLSGGRVLRDLCGTPGYLAPEVLRTSMYDDVEGYGLEVDMWACGVIMYTLLCGYAPFYHKRQIYMLRAISEGRYEFRSPEWDEVSEAAKDLIRRMLDVEPKKRITAIQALGHSFFQQVIPEEGVKLVSVFDAKKKFRLTIVQVRLLVRLLRIRLVPVLVSVAAVQVNPYATRKIRKAIDALAFRVYGHWVKKGREQFRDALFGNVVKCDMERFRKKPTDENQQNDLAAPVTVPVVQPG